MDKNIAVNTVENTLMYLLKYACLRQTQAVQTMPPTADGEARLTTTKSGK